ncbi:MAG TPA: DUF1684 domain-containing protein [Nitrososphaerales archaeon]|nr:DUF1684 domain-containing protein [Nitrososphaerales archaeon]
MEPDEVETWKRALLRFRAQRDEFMMHGRDSPFARLGLHGFHGLVYFEPDQSLRLEAKLQRYRAQASVMMTTSAGTRQLFNRVGRFDLTVGGQPVPLQAYQPAERDDPNLFIPFRDATSGSDTYGPGRYLEMRVEHDDEYLVDFNYAYNPYCAYGEGFVCPLPPSENFLKVAVRAGEKKYHG